MESARPIVQSPRPTLDGELLRAFVAFAETRNFTRAAAQVGLSQPALFERVKRLGDRLDRPLYRRIGRSLELTPEGEELAAFGRDMLARATAFEAAMAGEPAVTPVRLAAGEGTFLYVLGPALRAFDGEVAPRVLGGPSAAEALRLGEVELAVGAFDLVPRGLRARDVLTTPLCAALPRRHRLARRRRLKLRDLSRERPIVAPTGQRHRELVSRAFASVSAHPAPPLEADGWPLMLAYAAAGLGVAIVNGTCTPPKGVVLRPIPELGFITYRLLVRARGELRPEAQRLADAIAALG